MSSVEMLSEQGFLAQIQSLAIALSSPQSTHVDVHVLGSSGDQTPHAQLQQNEVHQNHKTTGIRSRQNQFSTPFPSKSRAPSDQQSARRRKVMGRRQMKKHMLFPQTYHTEGLYQSRMAGQSSPVQSSTTSAESHLYALQRVSATQRHETCCKRSRCKSKVESHESVPVIINPC